MKSVLLAALLPSLLANDTVRDLHAVATACLSGSQPLYARRRRACWLPQRGPWHDCTHDECLN
jgi:hypothetical protein